MLLSLQLEVVAGKHCWETSDPDVAGVVHGQSPSGRHPAQPTGQPDGSTSQYHQSGVAVVSAATAAPAYAHPQLPFLSCPASAEATCDATRRAQPADHQPPAGPAAPQTLLVTKRFRVVRVDESCRDGTLRTREIVEHPGSVLIVPLLADDQICLIRNVRRAVGATLWELPAGTLDREEPIAAAARRELEEETGYRADALEEVPGLWMSPGILRERMHVFVARGLTPGPQALEPGETIDTHVVAWSEAVAMCLDGRIDDAKTVAAILRLEAQRQQTG